MGWAIKTKESKGVTVYKIWSTITDNYLTKDWQSKQDINKFLFWHGFQNFVDKFVEDSMTFPNGYCEEDGRRFETDKVKANEYYNLLEKSLKDGAIIPTKFLEILKSLEIKLDVRDNEYNISTDEL